MIKSLYIKNYALVDELTINFSRGLNIITGETGAGKTIIVSAIAQLCGERSSSDFVRKGATKAIIEAEIEIPQNEHLLKLLHNNEIEPFKNELLILRKEINAKGVSRTFINDSPVSLSKLNEISSYLIDIHGQHQHQRLLHPENHIIYLDAFGKLEVKVETFARLLQKYKEKVLQREALKAQQLKSSQLYDMYRFQIEELTKANLRAEELDELKVELKKLNNIETIHQLAHSISELLYDGEVNASGLIVESENKLAQLSQFDEQFGEFLESLKNARITVEEIGRFLQEYIANLEFDPQQLEQIQERIGQLEFLLKKYQKISIQDLIDYLQEIKNFSLDIETFDEKITLIEREIEDLKNKIENLGQELSQKRKEVASLFEERITTLLHKLGMPNALFKVRFQTIRKADAPFLFNNQQVTATERGFDQIVFEFTSNKGEDFKPLHKVASGGEISRIMLSLKYLLAETDDVPSMIFDEIDAGISGKVAQIVGLRMSELSKTHQILCVTHLPQIAAFANLHFKVSKFIEDNRTLVDIKLLDEKEKIVEIAGLLGGQNIAPQTIENARHLILEAQNLIND